MAIGFSPRLIMARAARIFMAPAALLAASSAAPTVGLFSAWALPLGTWRGRWSTALPPTTSSRAALNSRLGVSPGARCAMWGYSGGALASEWAAELQVK